MAQITYGSITVSDLTDGKNANIWTTTVAPTTPNYTFNISNLTGSDDEPREGDIILYSVYRYTISSIDATTVLAGNRQSLQGAAGTDGGKWYSGTGITGTSTTATIFNNSGVANAIVGDMYLNTSTNNTYRCTVAGVSSVAKWVYVNNIKGSQGTSVTKTETEYYRKLAGGQAPQPSTTGSTTIPEYVDGCTYYTRTVTYLSAGDPVKGEWLEATTLTNQIKDAYEAWIAAGAVEQKAKSIVQDSNGVTVAAGINGADVTPGTTSTYGYNTIMAPTYLGLRYNAINLAKLSTTESTPELQFYFPSFSGSSNTPVQGDKGLTLGTSGMNFYHTGSNTADATLNSNGLTISNGSIVLGTTSGIAAGNVTLSNKNFERSINGTNHNDLRFAIGSKFGVASDGTLYSSGLDSVVSRVDKTEMKLAGTYALSQTSAGTAAKAATITPALSDTSKWELTTGTMVTVKFTNANTAANPTLNINSKGAKAIKTYAGGNLSADEYKWKAGSTFTFIYNGTNWLMQDSTASVRMTSAESSISQNASNIELKVSKDGVISSINQSAETIKIQASKVEIDGTAIFNAISDDVDDAITDKGYATTTQAQGYANDAKNEAIAEIPTDVSELNNDSGYQTASDVSGAIVSTTTLYYASNSTTAPNKPTAHVTTNSASTRGAWNIALPAYNASYPHLYVCTETKTKGGAYAWTSVEQTTYASAISAIKTTADGAAPKSSAIAEEQRIYYRSNSSTKPNGNGLPTTWVTETGDKYNTNATTSTGWSKKVTPIANGTGSSVTKYLYLWTCIQKKTVDGTVTYGDILLDDSTTVIDGGKIVTGSVSANAVSASSGTFDTANIPNLNASKITAGDISADRMKVNSISAINSNTDTVQIKASKVDIAGAAVFNNYSTTQQMNNAIGTAVDGIEVGGRNLLVGTGTSISKATTATSSYVVQILYDTPNLAMLSALGFAVNDEVTLSFDWKITSASTYGNARIEWYGKTSRAENSYIAPLINSFATFSASNTSGHVTKTVKLTSATVQAKRLVLIIYNSNLTLTISNLKLEKGNKATDWSPAPEDVQAEIDAKKSVHTLMSASTGSTYANILAWTAEGRENTSWGINTTATPIDKIKVGDTVRVAYKVTDMGTADNRPYVYVIGTFERSSGNTVYLTMHGLDTTIIDGGNILTNSIGANQIKANSINTTKLAIGDWTNLVTANELYPDSLPASSVSISNGYLVKTTATQQYIPLTRINPRTPNAFKKGDELYVEFYAKAASATTAVFSIFAYDSSNTYLDGNSALINGSTSSTTFNISTTETKFSGTITLTRPAWDTAAYYEIDLNNNASTKVQIYMRKVVVRKKSNGELIVDGSITADHLDTNAIVVGKMNQDTKDKVLNSNVLIGGRNLLPSTGSANGYFAGVAPNVTSHLTNDADNSYYREASATTAGIVTSSDVALESMVPNEWYTYTLWVKSTVARVFTIQLRKTTNKTDGGHYIESSAITPAANTWTKITHTFKATTANDVYGRLYIGAGTACTVYVKEWKLEKGNKATDWTPAPEDVQAEIDAKKSVHTLMTGNAYGNTYANILGFVAEGKSQQWTVNTSATPLTNVKVGDTCRIAYKVSDMNGAYVYPTGVVTGVGNNTVDMIMHGIDTTVIDGGNILTNSIGANQIAANAITADELAANAVTANKIATNAVTSDKIATGAITVGKINPVVYTYSNNGKGNGYAKLCTISVTENYRNKPIQFTLHSRNKNATDVSWRFLNSNSPSTCIVSSATYDGDTPLYYVGTGGTYTIYFALGESYDEVRIYDLIIPYTTGLTVTWDGAYYGTSLPSGAVEFIKLAGTRTSAELDNAAKTATTYITHIDNNGIRIHPSSTENNSVVINATGMEVFKGGTTSAYSVAKYGDSARIGKEDGSHLTLAPDSMSMSDGTKDVFNLLQKTMYIYWNRNYKGRQFANSTDRYVDSWDTNTTISTWDSIAVNYKLNNTSKTKKITSISNGVLVNDEIYVHFNYNGTIITLTYGRGSSAASSDIIKLESAVVYYVTDKKLSQLHTGTYPNTTVSGALRIGNGTSDSNRINLMLVDWSGTGKFKGDILAFCGADSSGGMSLTKAEENIDAFKYEDANGHVYIDAYRVGRIVSLLCVVSKTTSIAPGANLYQLNLTNAHLPKPLGTNTSGTGISGKNMIIGNIYYNRTVTPNRYEFVCRNGGSTAVSTGGVGFTITYICQMDEVSGEIKYMDD